MAHMLDDKENGFLAENNLEFWKSGALLFVHILAWRYSAKRWQNPLL